MIERNQNSLAINGGPAAVTEPIPAWPFAWRAVQEALAKATADSSWGQYHGRALDEFRDAFSEWLNSESSSDQFTSEDVWTCCSGTIAVELALRACGVSAEDQVLLAAYDFPGNFRAIESIGARPVLIDVQQNGFVIDPESIADSITPQTKAIIVSHLHGQLANTTRFREICDANQIAFVEDACQVPGAIVGGKKAGTVGDVGVFSFGGSKLLTAGRGGAVVARDPQKMQRIRIHCERGNDAFPMSCLQAAVLTPQLPILDELNQQRLRSATVLRESLAGSKLFQPISQSWNADWQPAFYKFPLLLKETGNSDCDRQSIIDALQAEGVPAADGFRGFAGRSTRRCDRPKLLEHSIHAASRTILLHHPLLLGDAAFLESVLTALTKIEKCFIDSNS